MQKKAQIFTVIAIFLIALVFLTVELYPFFKEREADSTRVSTMNSFLFSLEKNLERQVYISGFRIIFLAENKISSAGTYINVNNFFNEAFFNGTVNEVPSAIMQGVTYGDILNSVNEKARKINVNITMTNPDIIITQNDPWHINLTLKTDFVMNDLKDLVKWEKKQEISALIPIENFQDPLHTIGSNAKAPRNITKTMYEGRYYEYGNYANLLDHFWNKYYASNGDAPSFLKRLEGDISPDENGIESFVNTILLSAETRAYYDLSTTESVVDHIYYNKTNNIAGGIVLGLPIFRIDVAHELKYNITFG